MLTYNKRKILDFIGLGIGIWFWVEAVKGILQLMGVQASNHAVFMVTGSFDNPGPFGGFLAVVGTIAITYLITNRDRCSSAAKYSCISIAALLVPLIYDGKVYFGDTLLTSYIFSSNWYFFGGDNVLNSQDSRYLGLIPEEYIIGLVP